MKKIIIAMSFACLTAFCAEVISGSYNTTGGYQAGAGASGTYVSAFGAGAAAGSSGGSKSTFFGTVSGAASTGIGDSVGVGHYSLHSAVGSSSCVAIGAGAMSEADSCYRCVAIGTDAGVGWVNRSDMLWINGQVVANGGGLAIHCSPLTESSYTDVSGSTIYEYHDNDGKPPAIEVRSEERNDRYMNVLYLNADEVVITNGIVDLVGITVASAEHANSANTATDCNMAEVADLATVAVTLATGPATENETWTATKITALRDDYTNKIAQLEAVIFMLTNNLTRAGQ